MVLLPLEEVDPGNSTAIALIFLYVGGALMLLFMAYVMWGGVGRTRPAMGRGFGAIALVLAGYLIWQLYKILY